MNPLSLAARESGNLLRSFWRNRTGAFFTILLPVMFLVLFGSINRNGTVALDAHGPQISYTTSGATTTPTTNDSAASSTGQPQLDAALRRPIWQG